MTLRITEEQFARIAAGRTRGSPLLPAPKRAEGPPPDRAPGPFGARRGKFNAQRIVTDDGVFHSKGEHARWVDLKMMQRVGLIDGLERQVAYPLEGRDGPIALARKGGGARQVTYIADFVYRMKVSGRTVIEDFKGFDTKDSRLKRAILAAMVPDGTDIIVTK